MGLIIKKLQKSVWKKERKDKRFEMPVDKALYNSYYYYRIVMDLKTLLRCPFVFSCRNNMYRVYGMFIAGVKLLGNIYILSPMQLFLQLNQALLVY